MLIFIPLPADRTSRFREIRDETEARKALELERTAVRADRRDLTSALPCPLVRLWTSPCETNCGEGRQT